jgi:hypothetical protein
VIYLGLAFVAANVLHTIDHLRQGVGGLSAEILVAGTGLTIGAVVVLAMILREHPRAAQAAAILGIGGAAGIVAAHVAPHWSALSDPYTENGADAVSWMVMLLEVGTAAALGVAGLRASGVSRAPTPRPG